MPPSAREIIPCQNYEMKQMKNLVSKGMQMNIFSESLFVLCNRTQTVLKILYRAREV
jgi:hypothetical protein